ncbi:14213_t:CDS:1, partial [Dentiscutata erythropus]
VKISSFHAFEIVLLDVGTTHGVYPLPVLKSWTLIYLRIH